MTDPLDELDRGAAAILGRALTEPERETLLKYLELLVKWQKSQRLVGSTDRRWIVRNLFLDSLLFIALIPAGAVDVADFGSGAGLPGIPLRIVRPSLRVTLVEARARRVAFLREARRVLSLDDLEIHEGHVDETTPALAHRYDAVVMRCAGRFGNALQHVRAYVRPGGRVIASGPPRRYDLGIGEWVTVPGWSPGRPRLFAVYTA